ncbi:MAG: S8 family serine peptidase [Bacteroidetes bacterium]|nr:S8 family serine peptidase [Bacteroidota bacterium]
MYRSICRCEKNINDPQKRSVTTDILIKGDVSEIVSYIKSINGKIKGSAGDIVIARLPFGSIPSLLQQPFIEQIEGNTHHYQTMNDTMRMLCRVNEVYDGQTPLAQSYTGNGVIMGIIDSGLDLNHPDFKDSTGHTRVKWLWDMTKPVASNTPSYGYGQEWSGADIDAGLATSHTGEDQFGHGTYVTGIAAGNGLATGNWRGVAPKVISLLLVLILWLPTIHPEWRMPLNIFSIRLSN